MSLPSLLPVARRGAPLAAAALLCAALPTPAPAAVVGVNKAITVTSNTSDLLLAGFANGAAVSVVRDGVTIATAKNKNDPAAAPPEGGINSAHLLGLSGCWTGFTPQLLPGDTIKVGTDSTVIRDVTAQAPVVEGGKLILHGSATSVAGAPLTLAELDAQLHPLAGRFSQGSSGGQFLSTQNGDLGGVLLPDARGSLNWTASWPLPDNAADRAMALAADVIAAWTGPAAAPANAGGEQTDYLLGAEPGPVAGCEASPYAPNAPTNANHTTINIANAGGDLVVTGAAQPNVTTVKATLTDAAGKALTATAKPAAGAWSTTFPAAEVASLADGALKAAGAYTITGAAFHGATMSLTKDTIAPAAPTASVPAGTYSAPQNVALTGEAGSTVRYTTDGSDPTASSPAASGAVSVPGTRTIKAVAVDGAGNASPVASFAYVLAPAVAPSSAAARLTLRAADLTVPRRLRARTARRRGISIAIVAPEGAKVVRVRLVHGKRIITQVVRNIGRHRLITVVLPRTRRGRRTLRRGTYRVQVTPGLSKREYGITTARTMRLR